MQELTSSARDLPPSLNTLQVAQTDSVEGGGEDWTQF